MLLKTTLVPIFVTLSYTVSFLLVALLIIARLTVQRILPVSITTSIIPPSPSTSPSTTPSTTPISSSTYEGRQQCWSFFTTYNKKNTIPRIVKAWLLLASDTPIFVYLLTGILWLVAGPWVIGHFPDEFGVMMLWGMWFFPSTENGKFTQWLDCSMWATGYLLGFFLLLIVYFCIVTPPFIPLSSTSSSSPITYRIEFGIGARWITHILAWGLFVGVFLIVKLKIMYGSFPTWTLILSPVHTIIPALVIPLLIRETVFEMKKTFALEREKRKEEEKVDMETIAVHQTM